jgi:hypothetical protein
MRRNRLLAGLLPGAATALVLAACGGGPEYCSAREDLEQSVRGLGDVQLVASGGVQELRSQLEQIEGDARALVSSASSDFPAETEAIESSVDTLKGTLEGLPSSPEPADLARAATETGAVVTAVQEFVAASDSEC